MKLKLEAILSLTTPMHIADGSSAYYDPATNRISYGIATCPLTRTFRLPIVTPDNPEDENEVTRERDVPIIPGNTVRGIMRRKCAASVFAKIKHQNQNLSADAQAFLTFDAYHSATCGNRSGKPEAASFSDNIRKMRHPFVGLVGGTAAMIPSSMTTGIGIPICETTVKASMIPSWLTPLAASGRLTHISPFSRKDDLQRIADTEAPWAVIKDFEQQAIAYYSAMSDNAKARKKGKSKDADAEDGEKAKKLDLVSWNAIEMIRPGTKLHSHFSVDTALIGSLGLGLFFDGLLRFANHQRIGGWGRCCFGRYKTEIYIVDGDERTPIISGEGENHRYNDIPLISDAVAEWNAHKLDVNELENLL